MTSPRSATVTRSLGITHTPLPRTTVLVWWQLVLAAHWSCTAHPVQCRLRLCDASDLLQLCNKSPSTFGLQGLS